MIVSEDIFVFIIFISLIGGVGSFIIMIFLISLEKRLEIIEIDTNRMKLESSLKEAKFLHLFTQIK